MAAAGHLLVLKLMHEGFAISVCAISLQCGRGWPLNIYLGPGQPLGCRFKYLKRGTDIWTCRRRSKSVLSTSTVPCDKPGLFSMSAQRHSGQAFRFPASERHFLCE